MLNHLIHSFDHDEDKSNLKIPMECIIHQCLLERFSMIEAIYNIYFQYNPEFTIYKTKRKYGVFDIKFNPYKDGTCPLEYDTGQPSKDAGFPDIIDIRDGDKSKYEHNPTQEIHVDQTVFHIETECPYSDINISLHIKDNHLILMQFRRQWSEWDDHHNGLFIAVKPLSIDLLQKSISMIKWHELRYLY